MDPVRPNAVLRPIATDVGKCPDAAGPGEARHHRGDEGRTARPRPPVIRVGVSGAAERMRRALLQTVEAAPGICHGALWERPGHPSHGSDLNGRTVAADLGAAAQDVDVVFDFTSPDALFRHLEVAARAGLVIVELDAFERAQRTRGDSSPAWEQVAFGSHGLLSHAVALVQLDPLPA